MRQIKVAIIRIGKALAAGFARAQKMIASMMKKTAGILFGSGQAAPAMEGMEPDEADAPEQSADMQETVALERKRQGLEPQDVKDFALAQTDDQRAKIQQKMTQKTASWCGKLYASHRDALQTLATADLRAIEAHLSNARPIAGVPLAPQMFGQRPAPLSPFRPDIARQMVNDLKEDRAARAEGKTPKLEIVSGGKELDRAFGKRPIPTPRQAKVIPSTPYRQGGMSMSHTYKMPTPPASIYAAAGRI